VAFSEDMSGPDHPTVASALHVLGVIRFLAADYEEAENSLEQVLRIREAAGSAIPLADLAQSQNDLAQVYQARGKFHLVEPLLQRALETRQQLHGAVHTNVANALNNLAGYHFTVGNYGTARKLFEQTLEARKTIGGPDNLAVAQSFNAIGLVSQRQGDLEGAAALFQQALDMRERNKAPPRDVAVTLNNLGNVYQERGDSAGAEPLYRRALALFESSVGPNHPLVGQALSNLAVALFLTGKHTEAEPNYLRALEIRERALGPIHPDVATTLSALSAFYQATGKRTDALPLQARAVEIMEKNLQSTLAVGSEAQKTSYLQTFADTIDITFSLRRELGGDSVAATRVAATLLMRNKGRVLDVLTQTSEALRNRSTPEQVVQQEQLARARADLSRAVLQGKAGEAVEQRARVESIEGALSKDAPSAPDISIEQVQAALPADAALVEFLYYRPFNATETRRSNRFGAAQYVAFVLTRTGIGQWVELGSAAEIDQDVEQFRRAMLSVATHDVVARRLHSRVLQPLQDLIGAKRTLLIAPDGVLNLLPFAALRDSRGRYILETHTVSYVTGGRDLLRPRSDVARGEAVAIFADPTFGGTGPSNGASQTPPFTFGPLPGTREEARGIATLWREAKLYVGDTATETRLKELQSPHILHVATHGFFADGRLAMGDTTSRGLAAKSGSAPVASLDPLAPLLRSGIALAGANVGGVGVDDGVLTGLEAMSLRLSGTKLVVLSACETGVGEIRAGESVYGLRRALAVAGAESQVLTLWPVSDVATRDLMKDFYDQLASGRAIAEALRNVQLRMLRTPRWSHPAYWAPFLAAGATDSSLAPSRKE
jgi:CHAT domain-containing protein/Tfp pilus assembly protein PilF